MMTKPRTLIVGLLVSLAILSLPALPALASHTSGGRTTSAGQLEAEAGGWRTWVLTSGGQFRLSAPPDKKATRAEIAELKTLAASRDAAALDLIRHTDLGRPALPYRL